VDIARVFGSSSWISEEGVIERQIRRTPPAREQKTQEQETKGVRFTTMRSSQRWGWTWRQIAKTKQYRGRDYVKMKMMVKGGYKHAKTNAKKRRWIQLSREQEDKLKSKMKHNTWIYIYIYIYPEKKTTNFAWWNEDQDKQRTSRAKEKKVYNLKTSIKTTTNISKQMWIYKLKKEW
jgi:hypothetical protein